MGLILNRSKEEITVLKPIVAGFVSFYLGLLGPIGDPMASQSSNAATGTGCEVYGCKAYGSDSGSCGSISGDMPPLNDPGQGECECDGPDCVKKYDCDMQWTITFAAPDGYVLCQGGIPWGQNEQVTVTVSFCGESGVVSFEVREGGCTGYLLCTLKVDYGCRTCVGGSC